jgi:hypothetical protein
MIKSAVYKMDESQYKELLSACETKKGVIDYINENYSLNCYITELIIVYGK